MIVKLHKEFDGFKLNVEFESNSRRIGILGASGSGKSMTLRGISGIEEIDQGYIEVNGRVLADTKKKINLTPQQRKVGYMFQNYALFPTQTVEKNIMAGLSGTKAEKLKRVAEMVEKFSLMGLEKRLPGELSGGQQQRVALARIMAYEPEVILLDEPLSALDSFLKDRLFHELVDMLEEYSGTVIFVSHNRDEIYSFCDELVILANGKVVGYGDKNTIFKEPGNEEAARLIGCKNIVSIEVLGDKNFYVPDWEIEIHTKEIIPNNVTKIGYRAHDFLPVREKEENCLACNMNKVTELPFEWKYFLKSKGKDISWYAAKDEKGYIEKHGVPPYLKIQPDKIMYLKSNEKISIL